MYGYYALEAILATAFGRRVDIQRGESDDFSKAMDTVANGFNDGQFEQFILFNSKCTVRHVLEVYKVLG